MPRRKPAAPVRRRRRHRRRRELPVEALLRVRGRELWDAEAADRAEHMERPHHARRTARVVGADATTAGGATSSDSSSGGVHQRLVRLDRAANAHVPHVAYFFYADHTLRGPGVPFRFEADDMSSNTPKGERRLEVCGRSAPS